MFGLDPRMSKAAKTTRASAQKARAPKTSGTPTRRTSRRRKSSTTARLWQQVRRWPWTYVVVLLLGVVVWLQVAGRDSTLASTAEPTAEARLASFVHPATLSRAEVDELRRDYVATYAAIAQREMRKFGIPASITLAQGLLESVAGTSRLATETNNHFGMKCFSRSCRKGHCRNFSDDHHKDFFRNYSHPKESFRAHSEFLHENSRYASLFRLQPDDHAAWAHGLAKAGYATDPAYGKKLISLIDRYDLAAYDK